MPNKRDGTSNASFAVNEWDGMGWNGMEWDGMGNPK
jgi:hypothetical protein